ncbi:MAG: c-type cytochrome [Myxococcaceae bacterium]|nr:c-type cytochrome [Myxococcaceae bacterium]
MPEPWLAPLEAAESIPREPHREGDPARGRLALTTGDWQGVGVPWRGWQAAASPLEPKDVLPGRTGKNARVPYAYNVFTNVRGVEVVAPTCLTCHASHVNGELVLGLGNPDPVWNLPTGTALNGSAISAALWDPKESVEYDTYVVRIMLALEAGPLSSFSNYAAHRDVETLAWSELRKFDASTGLRGQVDVPPLWRVKKKTGLYANGMGRGDPAAHLMNMTTLSVVDVADAERIDAVFVDIGAYLRSLEPPRFPGTIDVALAREGEAVFVAQCARCHGTYGENGAYPNLLVPVAEVGTDPELATRSWVNAPAAEWFNTSFYGRRARMEPKAGYVAPPLDGIWATAPFLHNGSVPTLAALLDASLRPTKWSSAFTRDEYDLERVGWRGDVPGRGYDTTGLGLSNVGHTFGDALTADERRAVLEYLKTL